jgi:hypothetical protein
MKSSFLAVITFLFALAITLAAKDPFDLVVSENCGEVVFLRKECHGSVNILRSTISCNDWPRVVLIGDEAGGVYLEEGEYRFQVFSQAPWEPESSATACKSEILRVEVKKGVRIFVEVVPEFPDEDETTKFHWTLKEKRANQALLPTPTSVTDRAAHAPRQP